MKIVKNTFSQVITTDKVISEFGESFEWLIVRDDYDKNTYNKLKNKFGIGESSCIALAQNEDDPLLIIDDRKARTIAEEIGIECTGTLGILIIAKRQGIIQSVKPILHKIKDTNFRLSDDLFSEILRIVDEVD